MLEWVLSLEQLKGGDRIELSLQKTISDLRLLLQDYRLNLSGIKENVSKPLKDELSKVDGICLVLKFSQFEKIMTNFLHSVDEFFHFFFGIRVFTYICDDNFLKMQSLCRGTVPKAVRS